MKLEQRKNVASQRRAIGWACKLALLALASLLMSCADPGAYSDGDVGGEGKGLAPATQKLSFVLPSNRLAASVALGAANGINIGDRARVTRAAGFAPVTNGGAALATLGVESQVGATTSVGALTLRDRARVDGDAASGAAVTLGAGATVTGATTANTPIPTDRLSWSVAFPQSGAPLVVQPGQSASAAPGAYAAVQVYSGATLSVRSGTYYLDSLAVEPQARLSLDTRNGPVFLYIRQGFTFRGTTLWTGPNDQLLVGYVGTAPPSLDKSFDGTIVAPNATVRLGIGGSPYTGAVYAAAITVEPDVRFVHRPFARWDAVPFDVIPTLSCTEQRTDGSFAALLGYYNPNPGPATVPLGTSNGFTPSPQNHGQPTTFLPGRFPAAFSIDFGNALTLSWLLQGNSLAVSRSAVRCAKSASYGGFEDTTVAQATPNANFGAGDRLSVAGGIHALVRFDRAAIKRELGAGRFVTKATLELTRVAGGAPAVDAFAMARPWGEASATWTCANDTDASAGGTACAAATQWDLERDDVAETNPWRERRETNRVLGAWSGDVLRFDVTRDFWDLLGSEGIRHGMSWALVASPDDGALVEFKSSEVSSGPRLVLELGSRPEVDPAGSAPLSFAVDASIVPEPSDLGAAPDGAPRVSAGLRDVHGFVESFIERELVFHPADDAELAAILARWNGQVVEEQPAVGGRPDLGRAVAVRIDPARAASSALLPRMLELDNRPRGVHAFSNTAALATFAAAAEEAVAGRRVEINWVARRNVSLAQWSSRSISEGDDNTKLEHSVGKNPFHWPGFASCDPDPSSSQIPPPCQQALPDGTPVYQHLNVAEAWRALALTDRLTPGSVPVAILDDEWGSDTTDYPPSTQVNLWRWPAPTANHGHAMALSGYGIPGNELGGAGPGGGVGTLELWTTPLTDGHIERALAFANDHGNKIASASLSSRTSAVGTPFSGVNTDGTSDRLVIVSSAGNDGEDVDAEDCFVACWEAAAHEPCENDGVVCVGGLGYDGYGRHPLSNYGKSVNIAAPWHSYIHDGNDDFELVNMYGTGPGGEVTPADLNSRGGGTSTATAYLGGIVSLMFAANPSLSVKQAKSCLYSSARQRSSGYFTRIPDALRAVRCAIGGDPDAPLPGFVRIVLPSDGASTGVGEQTNVKALSGDYEGGSLPTIYWSSDIDGPLGSTGSDQTGQVYFESVGQHVLTATVATASGTLEDSVVVDVGCASSRQCGSVCCGGIFGYCLDPGAEVCCTTAQSACGSVCCGFDQVCDGGACVAAPPQTPGSVAECLAKGLEPPCSTNLDCPGGSAVCTQGCCLYIN